MAWRCLSGQPKRPPALSALCSTNPAGAFLDAGRNGRGRRAGGPQVCGQGPPPSGPQRSGHQKDA